MKLAQNFKLSGHTQLPGSVQAALRDLRRDVDRCATKATPASVIRLALDARLAPETFTYAVKGETLTLRGGDALGLIYGIYAVSEEWLGIPALWYWMDHEPVVRPAIVIPDGTTRESGTPAFRYRGWFMNDEDLLSHWAADAEAGIDFHAYQMAFEALLRCRGNMIIPGTSIFADEKSWRWAAERGLMLTEHHQDNLGLNPFRWPEDVPYNYLTHPHYLENAWRRSTRAKAAHGTKVIWTVGHRGKHDHALWNEVPELKDDPAALGKVLSDVIRRQVEIIREVDPDPVCFLNTWQEIAGLVQAGHIDLPPEVRLMWADYDGGSASVIQPGKPAKGDGVYYHVAMHGQSKALLAAWIPLQRIREEFARYQAAGATEYVVINLSNIRPFAISASLATRWLYEGLSSPDAALPSIRRFFEQDLGLPPEAGPAWYESLTQAAAPFGSTPDCFVGDEGPLMMTEMLLISLIVENGESAAEFRRRLGEFFILPVAGNPADRTESLTDLMRAIRITLRRCRAALRQAEAFKVSKRFRATFEYLVLFQNRLLVALWEMAEAALAARLAFEEGGNEAAIRVLETKVIPAAERQYALLRGASNGKWLGFYDNCITFSTRLPARRARQAVDVLRGHAARPAWLSEFAYKLYGEVKSYHVNRRENPNPIN